MYIDDFIPTLANVLENFKSGGVYNIGGVEFRSVEELSNLVLKYTGVETHEVDGKPREVYVHRKGATRAWGPGHPGLPGRLRPVGQPVLIGGTMGTSSWVLAGTESGMRASFGSACHGAGRSMSRHHALKQWNGKRVVEELEARGILIRSPSLRGVAEEAPGAYKDVTEVVEVTEKAGLARRVAKLLPIITIKG